MLALKKRLLYNALRVSIECIECICKSYRMIKMANVQVNIYANDRLDSFAEALLANFGLDNITAIDISSLANKLGLNVYSMNFTDNTLSGYIRFDNNEKKIFVNNIHPITRQRFTVAHEIAHYLLHNEILVKEGGTPLFRGGESNPAEQQANRLAAAILMPRSKVIQLYSSIKDINYLAQLFWVSRVAMSNRIVSLGLV